MDNQILNITLKKGMPITVGTPLLLPPMVSESYLFKGDAGNPFLAPRGVFLIKNHLFVTDTGQNRVFIWGNWKNRENTEGGHKVPG
jgi:hypothetical protein